MGRGTSGGRVQTGEWLASFGQGEKEELTPAVYDMSCLGFSSCTVSACYVCHDVIQ